MREIWTLDAETDPFKAGRVDIKPFIWGAYNGAEYHEFANTADVIEFFREREVIVYAHNGGKFDYFFMFEYLEPFEPVMLINGRLAKFKIGAAEFRDSYNILPVPLGAYKKDEIDYSIFEVDQRHKPKNWKKIRDYLRTDCIYLHEFVSAFVEQYGLNLTTAGAAMKTWQKIAQVKSPQTSREFYEFMSPFYYGGRVEVFRPGIIDSDFIVIDINSAYPFAMKHLHPYGNVYAVGEKLPKTRAGIQRAFIEVECVSRGALPFRDNDGSLVFPADNQRRVYNVTGWEYLAGLDTGAIENPSIRRVVTFPDSIRFDDYVDHFYAIKADAEKGSAEYIFAKLFLNSLYGKFGANPDKYKEYMICEHKYIQASESQNYYYCADLGPWALVDRELDESKQRYYNAAVAASITGFVRAYLWRAITECQGVIYCDTDSIFCENTGGLELDPNKLGSWDVEAACDFGAFAGKKLYAARIAPKQDDSVSSPEWKLASKGVRLSAAEIEKVARGAVVAHTPISPSFSVKRGVRFISRKIKKSA